MKTNWINIKDQLPDLYDVIGLKVSEPVLAYSTNGVHHIVSLWIDDKDTQTWRDNNGQYRDITHWQYLVQPSETSN